MRLKAFLVAWLVQATGVSAMSEKPPFAMQDFYDASFEVPDEYYIEERCSIPGKTIKAVRENRELAEMVDIELANLVASSMIDTCVSVRSGRISRDVWLSRLSERASVLQRLTKACGRTVQCLELPVLPHQLVPRNFPAYATLLFPSSDLVAEPHPGLEEKQLLLLGPRDQIRPDVILGHAHITGPEALALARTRYGCKYVHVVHTIPEEIEPLKTSIDGAPREGRFRTGSKKWLAQVELCKRSDLAISIGPRIYDRIKTDLFAESVVVQELVPGLDDELAAHVPSENGLPIARCLFSCRQEDPLLKGTDIVS